MTTRTVNLDCLYCDHVSRTESEAKKHRNALHPRMTRRLVCPHCPKTFNFGSAYLRHLVTHEPDWIERRFFEKVHMTSGCWVWTGGLDTKGYSHMLVHDRKWVSGHVISYTNIVGPIPEGMELDHLCRNPRCVRPDHLEPVTHRVNTQRAHDATRMKCPHCDLFTTKGNITRHVRSKHAGVSAKGKDAG